MGETGIPSGSDTLIMSGQVDNGKTRFEARLVVRTSGGSTKAVDGGIEITGADDATVDQLTGLLAMTIRRMVAGDAQPDAPLRAPGRAGAAGCCRR